MTSGLATCTAWWIMYAAVLSRRFGPPSITLPSASTRIRSEALIRLKAVPNGFTQNVFGWTGSRSVMWPAMPSSKPYLPKMRNAAVLETSVLLRRWDDGRTKPCWPYLPASLPFRYARCLYGSSNLGGEGNSNAFP